MNNLFKLFGLGFILLCFTSSCISYKNVPYFQDLDSAQVSVAAATYKPPVIQKNDLLGVSIATLSGPASIFKTTGDDGGAAGSGQSNGLLVDAQGEILLPVIGKLKVDGLTTNQAATVISEKVAIYEKQPNVGVRILNFKVSVTGDVAKPGVYPVANEKINILEAISLAGDLKITGKRNNVLVIRQKDGQVHFTRLDLRSKNLFTSPDFYLQNNDVLYIEPSVERLERDDNFYRNTTLVFSALTVITLVIFRL